jgi:hypothetical protein
MLFGEALGHQIGARLELGVEEDLEVDLDPFRAGGGRRRGEPRALLLVSRRTCFAKLRDRRPLGGGQNRSLQDVLLDLLDRVVAFDAERPAQPGNGPLDAPAVLDPSLHRVALADRLADDLLEGLVGGAGERHRKRAAERAVRIGRRVEQHAQGHLAEQLGLRRLVEHLKAGGDVGLERKLMQQAGAEGMDGLHLESARGFERGREQPARLRAQTRIRRAVRDRPDRPVEAGVVEGGPGAQRIEHPLRHVGGGRLGEGDAEDFFRCDAVEQQPDHPLRQHVGLAGARIGGDPGRHCRIGGLDLLPQHGLGNDAGEGHEYGFLSRSAILCLTFL